MPAASLPKANPLPPSTILKPFEQGLSFPWGECTYWVSQFISIPWSGNAKDWVKGAQSHGWGISNAPFIGSIAVYQPGPNVAGLMSSAGHVAMVTGIAADNKSYTISEMNFNGKVGIPDTRTVPFQAGTVDFIIPPANQFTAKGQSLGQALAGNFTGQAWKNSTVGAPLGNLDLNPFDALLAALPGIGKHLGFFVLGLVIIVAALFALFRANPVKVSA